VARGRPRRERWLFRCDRRDHLALRGIGIGRAKQAEKPLKAVMPIYRGKWPIWLKSPMTIWPGNQTNKTTMGKRNYLIEGVSGAGKTSVCQELRRRGYVAINGDRELAYQGDPTTGQKTEGFDREAEGLHGEERLSSEAEARHAHHIWDVEKVRRLAANQDDEATFFCGGSRNLKRFVELFDEVFILEVDAETLNERLDSRLDDDWGKRKSERELILRLQATKEDVPSSGIVIDATRPLVSVVDEILGHVRILKVKDSN
jgi:broad-specificity NMP kinase